MHILIAGGSGFLGSYLIKSLIQAQHNITLLSRHPERVDAPTGVKVVYWDGNKIQLPPQDKPIDAVINLCGLSIARYWSQSAKQAIRDSRIKPSQALVKWLCQLEKKPQVMLQISGIDYYNMPSEQCSETDNNGDHFLAQLSKWWNGVNTKMINNISKLCEISKNQINIKGKTTEKLGLIGKEKAIACETICSVIKYD